MTGGARIDVNGLGDRAAGCTPITPDCGSDGATPWPDHFASTRITVRRILQTPTGHGHKKGWMAAPSTPGFLGFLTPRPA